MNDPFKFMLSALEEAENALADYIPTLEKQGASLNYGRRVLAQVRLAITIAKIKERLTHEKD